MSVYNIFFSPTGNTKKVSAIISHEFHKSPISIDLSSKEYVFGKHTFTPEDICIFSVPSFGGRVPSIALEHIKLFKANFAKTIIVAVYGLRAYEDTLIELRDALHTNGFTIIAGIAAISEHSIAHSIAMGRPDGLDELQLKSFCTKIKAKLEDTKNLVEADIPGNYPYKEYICHPDKIKTSRACTGCLNCAKYCPVDAICLENPKQIDKTKCISCMRCVSICSANAKHISSITNIILTNKLRKLCKEKRTNELFL